MQMLFERCPICDQTGRVKTDHGDVICPSCMALRVAPVGVTIDQLDRLRSLRLAMVDVETAIMEAERDITYWVQLAECQRDHVPNHFAPTEHGIDASRNVINKLRAALREIRRTLPDSEQIDGG